MSAEVGERLRALQAERRGCARFPELQTGALRDPS